MKIRVSPDLCCGAQRCVAVAPQVYQIKNGYNALVGEPDYVVPENLKAQAVRGAKACPECAIQVLED